MSLTDEFKYNHICAYYDIIISNCQYMISEAGSNVAPVLVFSCVIMYLHTLTQFVIVWCIFLLTVLIVIVADLLRNEQVN